MKSYFANSFRVAMEQARKELGPEAMLVTTRTSALESRHLGEYEVVFAADLQVPENAAPAKKEQAKLPAPPPGEFTKAVFPQLPAVQPPAPSAELRTMLEEMRRQIKSGRKAKPAPAAKPADVAGQSPARDLLDELLRREVSPDIAQRLVAGSEARLRAAGFDRDDGPQVEAIERTKLRAALFEEIQDAFQVDSRLAVQPGNAGPIMLALVGPPGAGKTATIAKLAVRQGLSARKPAVLISLDTMRVGASEQLRCYASLLGLGFQVVETNRALEQTLEEHRGKELVLIDTPGFTLSDLSSGCDSADFLSRRNDIQKHLVLPASMRTADIARMAAAYAVFKPSRSIFTRMDETESYGGILTETIHSGRPIAFFCGGQRVPEDLSEATKREFAMLLLPSPDAPSSQLPVSRPTDTLRTAA